MRCSNIKNIEIGYKFYHSCFIIVGGGAGQNIFEIEGEC